MTQRDNNISYQIDSILTDVSQDQVQEDKQIRQINEDHLLIKEEPYQLVLNYREGFDLLAFENRYQEYFEKFDFIVGDWGFEQLRLRGFYQIGRLNLFRSDTWHRQFEGLLVGGGEVSHLSYGSRHILLDP